MKKKAILMVLLIALITGSAISSQLVHGAKADAQTEGPHAQDLQYLYAKDFWYAYGEAFNSPTWPGLGILFSDGWMVDSGAYYQFFMPAAPWDFTALDIEVYGKAVSGNGLDVEVWNWGSSSWDYVGKTGIAQGLYKWVVDPTNHIHGSSYEYRLAVRAEDTFFVNDKYDMYWIRTIYTVKDPCSFDEYFNDVNWYPFDSDDDGFNDAVEVEMDVDTTYGGTLTVNVDAQLRYEGTTVYSDTVSWSITDEAVEWGYAYLYVPEGFPEGGYTLFLHLFDQCDNSEDFWGMCCVYLYPPTLAKDTVLDFWFEPNPAKPGQTVQLKGTLKDIDGTPLPPAAQVEVEYSTDGGATWHYIWTLWTNWLSEFSKTFTAPGVGEYLVRVSYAGSATYNPSSDTETLIVQEVWGDYHFRLSPYTDVIHIKISGSVIYGVAEVQGVGSDLPLLGYIQGGTFYIFTDVPDGLYANEMSMMVGSTSTLSGNVYRTKDGKSWDGPTPFTLVSASSASGSSAMGQALASAVEPQSWPATYHFQLSPWIDIARLSVDGKVIHGTDEAPALYYDQPVLGYVSGSFFILGIDWTEAGLTYELGIIRASTSTMSGFAYRTTTGKSYISGPTISFVSVPP